MPKTYTDLNTKIIHAGEPDPRICGAVSLPIFQSATYEYTGEGSSNELKYIRTSSPER